MILFNWKEILLPYQQTVDELVIKFRGIEREYRINDQHSPIQQVDGRVKRIGSIIEKANRKNIPYDKIEEKIEDIAGIRIICRFVEDIERIIEIVRERNDLTIMQERDYIAFTKPSGYRSYHLIIKYPLMTLQGQVVVNAEIQIRTLAMNFWATIEHSLKYKYNGKIPDEVQKRLRASAEASFQMDKEMSTIRGEIMEAQNITEVKNFLVDEIMKKIQNLYYIAKLEKANELNKRFNDIFQECNINKLMNFNNELDTLTDIYKVSYI